MSRPRRCRSGASISATRCWRSRSISSGAIAASSSLGHGAFFALGGYAMGMYLMRQIGSRGVYGNPVLPDFMVFLNWQRTALVLVRLLVLSLRHADGAAGSGAARLRLRLVRLPQPRHRRLSLDHHPGADLCAAARLLPQRHGLWRQQRPDRFQGHPGLQRPGADDARRALFHDLRHADRRLPDRARHRRLEARQGA